ncbi:M14 family zinc carboxypeptidase [Longibacter sp.]|uniref:M14 family zinc carboxypeptidase n=1 Tax=Longibacter sp. TaxID=2045415 RepID=UPI003EBC7AB0
MRTSHSPLFPLTLHRPHLLLLAGVLLALALGPASAYAQVLPGQVPDHYYFPADTTFDPDIPSPSEFLGYDVGTYHTRHDRIVAYFRELARRSDRVALRDIGRTNEFRPMICAIITSPHNHANLESLRRSHLALSDPSASEPDIEQHPVVVQLGYGVHGNETSSSEVAMLQAYALAAGQGEVAEQRLRAGIFLVEPVLNPDGRDRHTQWANMHRGDPLVADPLDREHNEAWPGGRTNHYWFDLNRDWLPLTQIESRNRVAFYHRWRPNLVTDVHEMGTDNTYFFEPTEPVDSWNPLVPERVYTDLTAPFRDAYAGTLDDIGTLYFTKEIFDNSYPGYGSTYPNMQGGLGFVFEQASARGHIQQSDSRLVTFPYTIRNQLRTSMATVKTVIEERETLLQHQRDFFTSALAEADDFPVSAYVFGDADNPARTRSFLDLLLRHQIDVYQLDQNVEYNGTQFSSGTAYVVPTRQAQYRMVRTMFERVTSFADSVFYDTSAWSMALSYGLPHHGIDRGPVPRGEQVTEVPTTDGLGEVPRSSYAYLVNWTEDPAANVLHTLLAHDLTVKAAFEPFEVQTANGPAAYPRGSLLLPIQPQSISTDSLHRIVEATERTAGMNIDAVPTGFARSGVDLGSPAFRPIEHPRPLMIVGDGVSSYEAGQVWYVLDTRVDMPITKVDRTDLGRVHLPDYNTLVMVSGQYSDLPATFVEDLRRWIEAGNTLITIRGATSWAVTSGLVNDTTLIDNLDTLPATPAGAEDDGPTRYDYASAADRRGAQRIGGAIFETDLDITHPLGFGFTRRRVPVYRDHETVLPPTSNPFSTVAQYVETPRLSGYASDSNRDALAGSASLVVDQVGRGRIVLFADNPNFRGMWPGTGRLFFNALFFGSQIDAP